VSPNGQLAEITGHQPCRYRYDNADQLHTVTYPEVNPEQHHAEKSSSLITTQRAIKSVKPKH
jgi:hypothetical protein